MNVPVPPIVVELKLDGLDAMLREADPRMAMERAAFLGAQWLQGLWLRLATGMDVRGNSGRETSYIQGIQAEGSIRRVEANESGAGDNLTLYEVVYEIANTSPHASLVDYGHDAFHLPSVMSWNTPSVKRTKSGMPYVHIPMRHSAYEAPEDRGPGGATKATLRAMMPGEVYAKAQRLSRRQPLNVGPVVSEAGQFIARDRYAWTTKGHKRITRGDVTPDTFGQDAKGAHEFFQERRGARVVHDSRGRAVGTNPAWKSSKFEGMMKTGAPRHTSYLTIRTITPNSEGWHIPAVAGLHIVDKVAEAAQGPELQQVMQNAMLGMLDGAKGGGQ